MQPALISYDLTPSPGSGRSDDSPWPSLRLLGQSAQRRRRQRLPISDVRPFGVLNETNQSQIAAAVHVDCLHPATAWKRSGATSSLHRPRTMAILDGACAPRSSTLVRSIDLLLARSDTDRANTGCASPAA